MKTLNVYDYDTILAIRSAAARILVLTNDYIHNCTVNVDIDEPEQNTEEGDDHE